MDISFRPATPDDLEALFSIMRENFAELGRPLTITRDDLQREWFGSSRFDPATGSSLAIVAGEPVGFTAFEVWYEQVHSEGYVLPSHRDRGIGSALVAWLVEQARTHEGVESAWAHASGEMKSAHVLLEDQGFQHVRSFFSMVNSDPASIAPAVWPTGIELRPARTVEEACELGARGWNMSFIDHWNFHPDEPSFYLDRVGHPEEDISLWVFAYEGETLAGFCLTSLRTGDGKMRGQLGPIGTARSHRGIGLGRALLRNGVKMLADRGAEEVRLGVDTENPSGAVKLYESNGFMREREGRAYRLDL